MTEKTPLVQQIKQHGWEAPAGLLLDVLEPFGALGAQVIWVAQPLLGAFIPREMLSDLAVLLEDPDALDEVRRQLDSQ